jgi:hypothetical protein
MTVFVCPQSLDRLWKSMLYMIGLIVVIIVMLKILGIY